MRKFIGAIALLLCFCSAWGQVAEPSDSLLQVYQSTDARFYRFNYPSKSASGEDVVLSSLLIAWMPSKPTLTDSIESLHIYSHYTITADKESPSSDSNMTDRLLFGALVKGKYGLGMNPDHNFIAKCIVIAPDYEGYGVSKDRNHPYLSQDVTAQQVLDAVDYGMMLYEKHVSDERALAVKNDWRSYSWGFSQGGTVALAVQRHIEQNELSDALHFHGSICGDGPYDMIETLRYYMNDDGTSYDASTSHQKGMTTMPMVIPMIIKGMLDSHPDMQEHTLEDYISQQLLDTGIMDWIASKTLSTGDIHKLWYKQLQEGLDANGRHYTPEQMAELFYSPAINTVWARVDKLFTPGFYAYIQETNGFETAPTEQGDVWQDLHRAMMDNSLSTGWEPQHRIQFVHSKGDTVVPYSNYLAFRDAHIADEGELFRIDDSLTPLDHTAAGTSFFISLVTGSCGDYFTWLDEISDPTSIKPAFAEWQTESLDWYSLDGRRLNTRPTAKGIYIHAGRKVLVK